VRTALRGHQISDAPQNSDLRMHPHSEFIH
jgi:hypothetical protein